METKFTTHEEYIIQFDGEAREKLLEIYEYLAEALPGCTEVISYSMPAFKHKKVLVYYAAFSKHIGFFPTASGIEKFKDQLGDYKFSKGGIQFPFSKKLPKALIQKIAKYRLSVD